MKNPRVEAMSVLIHNFLSKLFRKEEIVVRHHYGNCYLCLSGDICKDSDAHESAMDGKWICKD